MAEVHIEALGSKDQHEELRDFHSRFDRELDPMQAGSKIIDIHSTAKEPTNHYPELLKDLLDCIPYIEPFCGDTKDRNRGQANFPKRSAKADGSGGKIIYFISKHFPVPAAESSTLCSSFVPISSGESLGASDDFSKQVHLSFRIWPLAGRSVGPAFAVTVAEAYFGQRFPILFKWFEVVSCNNV